MKKLMLLAFIPMMFPVDAHAVTCFKTGEQISGFHKICFYDCLGSTAAITIGSLEFCPLTINR